VRKGEEGRLRGAGVASVPRGWWSRWMVFVQVLESCSYVFVGWI
jgi:hypothetical protein